MKKYINILFLSIMLLSFSCKKALMEKPHSLLTAETFYKTKSDANAALNGAFAVLQYQDYYQRTALFIIDLPVDLFKPANTNSARVQLFTGTYTPTNGQLYNWWIKSYLMIQRANDVITYVPNIPADELTDKDKNNILGNARFLRAFGYFNLVRAFGDVPLVLNVANDNLFPARTPAAQVYEQIISDLQFAEANCYHTHEIASDEVGRVSSEAATTMLAKAYLQKGSTTYGDAGDNQKALDACNKVIAYSGSHPGNLNLSDSYTDIFDPNMPNGIEAIFSVQFGAAYGTGCITKPMFNPGSMGGFGTLVALDEFYDSYDAMDVERRTVNVGTTDGSFRYISKYDDPSTGLGWGRNNTIVLRYADVLLMRSEALNNISPSNAAKFEGINMIRQRSMPASTPLDFTTTPTAADFVNALSDERHWEFGVEGQRRWDVIRLKKYQQIKQAQGFTIDDNHLLYPIPQSEIDVNTNLVQNPGYN